MDERRKNYSSIEYFTQIPAKEATATQAMVTCRKLGMKLLELRTHKDVSRFLAEYDGGVSQTPASIFYDQRTRSFVFASDNLPIKDHTAITKTPVGYDVSTYDTWDSYRTYFGRYVMEGAQIFLEFVRANTKYDHFYCQRPDTGPPPGSSACKTNLQFIEDITSTHQDYLQQLRKLLNKGYGEGGARRQGTRDKRTNPLFSGVVGGIFGAVTTELFTRISSDDKVAAAAARTEEILGNLKERANALDVNQKRLYTLMDKIQLRLNQRLGAVAQGTDLSNIHIQINSILIHVSEHLSYLYRLLAGGDTDTGINLAISEEERMRVLEGTKNQSKKLIMSPGKPIIHRFQFLAPEILCLILEVPIKAAMTSVAALETVAFPTIQNGSLWYPLPKVGYFLHFSGSYFVEVGSEAFQRCRQHGICSGMFPLQYADDTVRCHIAQYFGYVKSECRHEKLEVRRFLMQTGNSIAYALLDPLSIKIECITGIKDTIISLLGRGVVNIPEGCMAVTNKAVLTSFKPARLILEQNISLPGSSPLTPSAFQTRDLAPISLDLLPTHKESIAHQKEKGLNQVVLVWVSFIGGVFPFFYFGLSIVASTEGGQE